MKEKDFGSLKVLGMKVLPSYLITFLLFTACLLSGCIEKYEANIPEDDSDILVVEGTIYSSRMNKFVLSRTVPLNSSSMPKRVTGATVSVRGSDGSEYAAQDNNNGSYACQVDDLSPDAEYYLHIEVNGEVYESEPQKPMSTEKIADIRGVQNTPESDIDILITPSPPLDPNQAHYYSWTYDETWEVHPAYLIYMAFNPETLTTEFITNPFPVRGWMDAVGNTIMVGASTSYEDQHIQRLKMYDIDRKNERVHFRYSGLVHQRSISKAEYEYDLARRQAGTEMGGLFTPQPSALPSNVHCLTSGKRVIGFVGCSLNTSEYRFFLNAEDYSVKTPRIEDTLYWLEDCSEYDCRKLVNDGMYLCVWEDNRMMPGGKLRTAWASEYQLDVRLRGAYIDPPDYWLQQENISY